MPSVCSLRGISRSSGLAYDTVVNIVQAAALKAQMVHNAEVQDVDTDAINADELWSFVQKNIHQCLPEELEAGDCWIALSLAQLSGLILAGRVGKHTDELAQELVTSTEGKTDCFEWDTDGWEAYGRVLPSEVDHYYQQSLDATLGANQWHCASTNRTLASPTKRSLARFGSRPR